MNWQPSASLAVLRERANFINQIRDFFAKKNILEVDTPVLQTCAVTDPNIECFKAFFCPLGTAEEKIYYLQTSPEYAMKRLLAAGSGPIYQICKAFRNGEVGRKHNPEFTMLEWYQPGYTHQELMNEVGTLLTLLLPVQEIEKLSYREAFQHYLGFNPHEITITVLKKEVERRIGAIPHFDSSVADDYLDLLFTHCIEENLGRKKITFIYDYPASQAALSTLGQREGYKVAERFEIYIEGMELGNGFHELSEAREQRARFLKEQATRQERGKPSPPLDEYLLAALESGLPNCSGVAIGLDRLLMIKLGLTHIADVLSFDFTRI